jgi:hypothetical protein
MPNGDVGIICYWTPRRRKNVSPTWPMTRKQLYAAGYNRMMEIPARPCKRCGTRIEFWRTPEDHIMPIEENREHKDEMLCHFSTCPHAAEFRKPEHKARPIQRELF